MARTLPGVFYEVYGKTFPIIPRIRKSFWGMLLMAGLFLLLQFGRSDLHVRIKPDEKSIYSAQTITHYGIDTVRADGELIISSPTVMQKILLTDTGNNLDIISLLFIGVISIIIIRITPNVFEYNLFRKDVSRSIRLIGFLMILHAILRFYSIHIYTPSEVGRITHDEFMVPPSFPILSYAEIYTALIVIAIGSAYERGIKLQKEQDLTV